ncbi:glutaredoxin family protein [Tropicimonas sp. IMCC6043]|uniref:glutaredoxin family protein n=1 Tax=Tropicimonas sp. IMCC6043 TaxID=2510645 RepID=UPI00101D9FDA|nr:glutaredoxin family protein [Tropicimonas sp. IMCC6043]RYH06372.1 glutaredoxin family protein [Tropicimonas sp. IMCC6043]
MTITVIVYSTPTCPDCRTLKAWLRRLGIDFSERDLTELAVMDEAKQRFGVRVAPITEIGDWFTYGTFEDQKPRIEARLREVGIWPI